MAAILQVIGALLILAGYGASQARLVGPDSYRYLLANLAGSAVLAVLAFEEQQWGFLLLEGVWAVISAWGILSRLRGGRRAAADWH